MYGEYVAMKVSLTILHYIGSTILLPCKPFVGKDDLSNSVIFHLAIAIIYLDV